jgi:hypothetical protein
VIERASNGFREAQQISGFLRQRITAEVFRSAAGMPPIAGRFSSASA